MTAFDRIHAAEPRDFVVFCVANQPVVEFGPYEVFEVFDGGFFDLFPFEVGRHAIGEL